MLSDKETWTLLSGQRPVNSMARTVLSLDWLGLGGSKREWGKWEKAPAWDIVH